MTLEEYKGAILPQQAEFAEHYIRNGYNGKRAAMAANYSEKSAESQASRLLSNAKVKAYVDALDAEKYKGFTFDKEVIKQRLEWLNNSDILDYVEFDGKKIKFKAFDKLTPAQRYAIKGIKSGKYGIELTLHDKAWNADMIAKNIGLYEADNKQKEGERRSVALLLPDNTRTGVAPLPDDQINEV